jgi:hypothetical protein
MPIGTAWRTRRGGDEAGRRRHCAALGDLSAVVRLITSRQALPLSAGTLKEGDPYAPPVAGAGPIERGRLLAIGG